MPASAAISFSLSYSAQADADLSASDKQNFSDAVAFWDSVIDDHQDLQSRSWTLNVDTFSQAASGGGVLLGSAGPNGLIYSNVVSGSAPSNERFIISTGGQAQFNTHPDAGTLSLDTIKHEMGHALGIGTLWEDNEVYNDGVAANHNRTLTGGTPGEYVGANALAAYQAEFVGQGGAAFIPVELGGGSGTAHGHWNEEDDFGQTATGIVQVGTGNDMRNELMTGWAAPGTDFFSEMTRGSLQDIGFTLEAIPEPSSVVLSLAGLVFLGSRRKRS
ncbi:MAG: PEP-CTERM sorting domain-containing protein [Verrucomicrobiaceae bacterium]